MQTKTGKEYLNVVSACPALPAVHDTLGKKP